MLTGVDSDGIVMKDRQRQLRVTQTSHLLCDHVSNAKELQCRTRIIEVSGYAYRSKDDCVGEVARVAHTIHINVKSVCKLSLKQCGSE